MVMPRFALTTIRVSFILVVLSRVTGSPVDPTDLFGKRRRAGSSSRRSGGRLPLRNDDSPPWGDTDSPFDSDEEGGGEQEDDYPDYSNSDENEDAETRRLLLSFGLSSVPKPNRRAVKDTPTFMLELYEKLRESQNLRRYREYYNYDEDAPPAANTVRSYKERGLPEAGRKSFEYEVTGILDRETVVSAELVLFKRRPSWPEGAEPSSPTQKRALVQVFQVYMRERQGSVQKRRSLIDERIIDVEYSGFLQFNVSSAFLNTEEKIDYTTNILNSTRLLRRTFEIRIKAKSDVIRRTVRFIKNPADSRPEKQPLLVLYLNDNLIQRRDIAMPLGTDGVVAARGPHGWKMVSRPPQNKVRPRLRSGHEAESTDAAVESNVRTDSGVSVERTEHRRKRRAGNRSSGLSTRKQKCQLYHYRVNFQKIGWDNWIIAPDGYSGNFCEGFCPFPLVSSFNGTNHSLVQAILHAKRFKKNDQRVPSPCCVPNNFEQLSVLYSNGDTNIILKEFADMIAKSCACL